MCIVKRELLKRYKYLPFIVESQEITSKTENKNQLFWENQDGGVGRHTAPPRTTRTDRESNSKGDQHQGNRK